MSTPPSQPLPAGAAGATGNRVLVHPRQKGNVVLKHIRNVPWEYSEDIAPDFMVGQRNCVTFLSLR
jgi:DNA excision repair protein ERCC-1